jgi:hypothetical protein
LRWELDEHLFPWAFGCFGRHEDGYDEAPRGSRLSQVALGRFGRSAMGLGRASLLFGVRLSSDQDELPFVCTAEPRILLPVVRVALLRLKKG